LFNKLPLAIFIILEQIRAALASLLIVIKDKQRVLVKEYIAVLRIKEKNNTTYN
jgi:hypothetical protein